MAPPWPACYNRANAIRKDNPVLKVETKLREDHQATLTVEVDQERVERALKAAARKIARQVRVPGFRKGKVPYHIIVSQFGEGALYDEALEPLGQDVYKEALEQSDLEPYAPGSLDDVQLDPMVLSFTVPLRPEVNLGAYRKIRLKRGKVKVSKDEVEEALEALRAEQAVLEPVERGIEKGDVASFDLKGTFVLEEDAEPETLIERKGAPILIDDDIIYPLPGFAEQVLGMQAGEQRSFTLTIPEDLLEDESLAGKVVSFDVTCIEVKRRDLPRLDDEFAQSVGDFENLKALRAHIREDLEAQQQRQADEEYADQAMEAILEKTTFNYPPIMLEEWLDRTVNNFEQTLKRQQNLTLEDYFAITDTDVESMREDLREDVEDNLRRALALGQLAEDERLSVDEDEIADEIETMLLSAGQQAALARHFLQSPATKNEIHNSLLIQKTRERLVEIASGNAPPLEELETQTDAD
jgi:trigger factor